MSSSSTSPWWRFRTASGSQAAASTAQQPEQYAEDDADEPPIASTSAVTVEDLPGHGSARRDLAGSGNTSPQAGSHHLHSLTERKLEMAVLGRAVGLRQLVLLSNAFASKAKTYATNAYGGPGTNEQLEEGELDANIVDLEDEMNRKKREEDWLDSVLDEMLTDEEDDYDPPPIPDAPASSSYGFLRGYQSGSQGLREPYVHVSIRDRRNAPGPLSLQTSEPYEQLRIDLTSTGAPRALVGDSGFLEPALIPLPESTDTTPDNSTTSQASDDEAVLSTIEEELDAEDEEAMFEMDGLPPLPESDDGSEETIPDPYRMTNDPLYLSNYRDEALAATPDLAYSSNSLNSFLTNLSSSPSGSFGPTTPNSSPFELLPALDSFSGQTFTEQSNEEVALRNVTSEAGNRALQEGYEGDKIGSVRSADLQLVPYYGKLAAEVLGESAKPVLGAEHQVPSERRGVYAVPASSYAPPITVPKLPSALLSSILGQRPPIAFKADRTPSGGRDKPAKTDPSTSSVSLPIFLPHEVVKALYDSVDFGLPPKSSSPVSTPSVTQASLPAFTLAPSYDRSHKGAGNSEITVRSAPTSPRGRRKSLSLLDIGGVSHDSSGSLLFSSLGLAPMPDSRSILDRELVRSSEASITRHPEITTASFGRGIVADWAFGSVLEQTQRGSASGDYPTRRTSFRDAAAGRRNDSRSPSRLRHFHQLDAVILDDFDFGSA